MHAYTTQHYWHLWPRLIHARVYHTVLLAPLATLNTCTRTPHSTIGTPGHALYMHAYTTQYYWHPRPRLIHACVHHTVLLAPLGTLYTCTRTPHSSMLFRLRLRHAVHTRLNHLHYHANLTDTNAKAPLPVNDFYIYGTVSFKKVAG